jgi:hypothetical protein
MAERLGDVQKFFDTSFGKFLIVLAVFGGFIYWIHTMTPPPTTTNPWQRSPDYRSDLRYYFAEAIRLDGARSVLEQAESADVERFNRMVVAYNQSCANLREKRTERMLSGLCLKADARRL